jgi:hypothetical protein
MKMLPENHVCVEILLKLCICVKGLMWKLEFKIYVDFICFLFLSMIFFNFTKVSKYEYGTFKPAEITTRWGIRNKGEGRVME